MKKLMKSLLVCLIVPAVLLLSACSKAPGSADDLIQFQQPQKGDTIATMKTSKGDIKIRLFEKQAPKAVENFVTHAKNGYYDGLSFHRVIGNFMIQGGDPNGDGTGGESIWNKPFEDEFSDELYNFRGALSMANSGADSNGSQFFIVQANNPTSMTNAYFEQLYKQAKEQNWANKNYKHPAAAKEKYAEVGGTPHLDHMHTVFGQVIDGMDIVDVIADVETDQNDKPIEDVLIQSITIEEVQS